MKEVICSEWMEMTSKYIRSLVYMLNLQYIIKSLNRINLRIFCLFSTYRSSFNNISIKLHHLKQCLWYIADTRMSRFNVFNDMTISWCMFDCIVFKSKSHYDRIAGKIDWVWSSPRILMPGVLRRLRYVVIGNISMRIDHNYQTNRTTHI